MLLFVGTSKSGRLRSIFASLESTSVLTVSDIEEFALKGGMIRFVTAENKTRFRINVEATEAANLTVSSKLLHLSEIVSTTQRP